MFLFQLCSIIDTVIRQLTKQLTKYKLLALPPAVPTIEKVKSLNQQEMNTR